MVAEADAKKGFNIAKRAGVADAVLDDVKVHSLSAPRSLRLYLVSVIT